MHYTILLYYQARWWVKYLSKCIMNTEQTSKNIFTDSFKWFISTNLVPRERGWVYIDHFFENSFCPIEEANGIGNDLNSQNIKVLRRLNFLFSRQRLLSFLNFMKTSVSITNSTLTKVWPWHSRTKIRKITRKVSCKFCKRTFFEGEQPDYLHIFLNTSQITKFDKIINSGKVYHRGLVHNMQSSYYKWL